MNILTKGLLIGLAIGLILGFAGGYGINSYQAFDGGGGGGGNGGYGTGTPEELFADAMAVELAKVIYEANPETGGPRGLLNNFLGKVKAQSNELPTEKEIKCYSANSESIGRAIMAAVDSRVDGLDIPAGSSTSGNGCWLMEITGQISGYVDRYKDKTTVVRLTLSPNTTVRLQYYDENCRLQSATLSVPSSGIGYYVFFKNGILTEVERYRPISKVNNNLNMISDTVLAQEVVGPPPFIFDPPQRSISYCSFSISLTRTIGSLDPNRCPNCQTSGGGGGGINTNE